MVRSHFERRRERYAEWDRKKLLGERRGKQTRTLGSCSQDQNPPSGPFSPPRASLTPTGTKTAKTASQGSVWPLPPIGDRVRYTEKALATRGIAIDGQKVGVAIRYVERLAFGGIPSATLVVVDWGGPNVNSIHPCWIEAINATANS